MKKRILFWLVILTALHHPPVIAQTGETSEKTQTTIGMYPIQRSTIDSMHHDIQQLELKENRLLLEKYLECAANSRKIELPANIIGIDIRNLCEQVDSLKQYYSLYLEKVSAYNKIRQADKKFQKAQKAKSQAKTKEEEKEADSMLQKAYQSMNKNNPAYTLAYNAVIDTRIRYSIATYRYLLDKFQSKGELFPLSFITYKEQRDIKESNFELKNLSREISTLKRVLQKRTEQYYEQKY